MANSGRSKSPEQRLRGYKAEFRKTSKGGVFYIPGIPPRHAKFFTFDSPSKDNVICRPGFTVEKVLAEIGGEPIYKHTPGPGRPANNQNVDKELDRDAKKAEQEGSFDPRNIRDGRKKVFRGINLRRGQLGFRKKLLNAYSRRCAITDCDCTDVLEAAHILPYRGEYTNHVQNGILLRSDIHTLFDIGMLGFAPTGYKVVISKTLTGTVYEKLKGKKLRLPSEPNNRPSEIALRKHLKWCRLQARAPLG